MKNRLLTLIFGFLFCFPTLNAQDNLEPVESIFDNYDFEFEYYSIVRKTLMNGMSDYPEIRFLIIPSFTVEQVIAIEKDKKNYGKYFIVYHKMKKSIWYTEKNKEKIKVEKKRIEISMNNALLFKELFKKAVNNQKYPENENMGLDGTNYYFSIADRTLKTGTVWSPNKGTKMYRLKEIGYSLIGLANETKKGKIAIPKKELIERIKNLTDEIKN